MQIYLVSRPKKSINNNHRHEQYVKNSIENISYTHGCGETDASCLRIVDVPVQGKLRSAVSCSSTNGINWKLIEIKQLCTLKLKKCTAP